MKRPAVGRAQGKTIISAQPCPEPVPDVEQAAHFINALAPGELAADLELSRGSS
jgi:hypothetical protein